MKKYKLDDDATSDRIADFLTGQLLDDDENDDDKTEEEKKTISSKQFAKKFNLSPEDATIFLTWTEVCMKFKRDTDLNASRMGVKK